MRTPTLLSLVLVALLVGVAWADAPLPWGGIRKRYRTFGDPNAVPVRIQAGPGPARIVVPRNLLARARAATSPPSKPGQPTSGHLLPIQLDRAKVEVVETGDTIQVFLPAEVLASLREKQP